MRARMHSKIFRRRMDQRRRSRLRLRIGRISTFSIRSKLRQNLLLFPGSLNPSLSNTNYRFHEQCSNSLFSLVFNHIAFPSSIQATGGSGNYSWSSTSTDVAAVTSLGQVVTSSNKGETTMRATDTRNAAHFDTAQVAVLPPAKMAFLPSRVEAEVDSSLELPLAVYTKRGAVRSRNHTE